MLGHRIHAEPIIVPGFVGIGRNNIPRDVGIPTEVTIVPGFVGIGRHNIPRDVGMTGIVPGFIWVS